MNLVSFRANPCYLVITPHQVRSGVRFRLNTLGLCSSSTVDTLLASAAFGLNDAPDSGGSSSGGGGSGGSGGGSSRSRITEVSVFLPAPEASRHGPTYLLTRAQLTMALLTMAMRTMAHLLPSRHAERRAAPPTLPSYHPSPGTRSSCSRARGEASRTRATSCGAPPRRGPMFPSYHPATSVPLCGAPPRRRLMLPGYHPSPVRLGAALRPGLDPCYLVITPHPCAFVRRSA